MKRHIWLACIALPLVFARGQEPYRVGVEDVLEIKVMDQRDMDGLYAVAPDGSVSFPMVGTVPVKDLTLDEVRNQITSRLESGYLRYPVVTVSLAQARKKTRYFVYGEVKAPGEYPLPLEAITALRAITTAGGISKGGSAANIKILRPKGEDGSYEVIKLNLKTVMSSGEGDVVVKDGDTLIVQSGLF